MTGRPVDAQLRADARHDPRRWVARALGLLLFLALGILIGSQFPRHDSTTETPVAVTVPAVDAASPRVPREATRSATQIADRRRTRAGAVAAASAYIGALDGTALVDASRLRRLVGSIASAGSRSQLLAAYAQVAAQARERLGVDTVPAPVVVVRAAPVGYRVDSYTPNAATVAIWRVGIVGSGATVEPQQSWRTEVVSLVWERGDWKVKSFTSVPGPTPPLGASVPSTAAELFASIPRFEEFPNAAP